jgi:hypothetical protein
VSGWIVFTVAAWVIFVLAVAPRLSWDEFEERHRPMLAVLTAASLPVAIVCAPPVIVAMFFAVCVTEIAPRQIAKWWSASWAS